MKKSVDYQEKNGVAHITMNDGKVNVMSCALMEEISEAFEIARSDKATVLLRSGRSGIFSAGFDLKTFASGDLQASIDMLKTGANLAIQIMQHPYPTVGVMEGHAYPMGAFLLLSCDFRLGVSDSYRIGMNEVAIGIAPPGFAIELARSRLHSAWLNRTVVTGEMFGPEDAVAAGFLDKVVPPEKMNDAVECICDKLRGLHQPSHARAKQSLRTPTIEAMKAAMRRELTIDYFGTLAAERTQTL